MPSSPDLKTREYPPGDPTNDEYNEKGYIRKQYDKPNAEGFKWYSTGQAGRQPALNKGILVWPLEATARPLDAEDIRLKLICNNQPPFSSEYAWVVMIAHNIGRERVMQMVGNVPFSFYQVVSQNQIFESELALEHEVVVKPGEGLLIAPPAVGQALKRYSNKQLEGIFNDGIDPTRHLFYELPYNLKRDKLKPLDLAYQSALAVKAASIPLRFLIRDLLHGLRI